MGVEGNWGSGIIGLAATCEFLVLVVIILRIYTRVWIAKAFWWDDFTIILAVVRDEHTLLPYLHSTERPY